MDPPQQPEPVTYVCGGNPLDPYFHLMIGFVMVHRNHEGLALHFSS
jgi:hypothetical protein